MSIGTERVVREYTSDGVRFALRPNADVGRWAERIPELAPAYRDLTRYILQLIEEGYATPDSDAVLLRWPSLYQLMREAAHASSIEVLNLPKLTDRVPALESRGGVSDQAFTIFVSGW